MNTFNILIAEDEPLARELLVDLIKDSGHVVAAEAVNGRDVIEKTLAVHPDVILMDIKMPEMDGIEATRQIWKTRPTPVIIISAFGATEFLEEATAAGVSAYLTKPVLRGDLLRTIEVAVARFKDYLRLQNENAVLHTALKNIQSISGIIHICANCKRVHDDDSRWLPIELYIEHNSDVSFSHGLCPDCAELLYPQFFKND